MSSPRLWSILTFSFGRLVMMEFIHCRMFSSPLKRVFTIYSVESFRHNNIKNEVVDFDGKDLLSDTQIVYSFRSTDNNMIGLRFAGGPYFLPVFFSGVNIHISYI